MDRRRGICFRGENENDYFEKFQWTCQQIKTDEYYNEFEKLKIAFDFCTENASYRIIMGVRVRNIFEIRQVKIYSKNNNNMNDFRPNRPCEESLKNVIFHSIDSTHRHTRKIYISHSNSDENITQSICIHTCDTHTPYFHFSSFISILFLIRFSSIYIICSARDRM